MQRGCAYRLCTKAVVCTQWVFAPCRRAAHIVGLDVFRPVVVQPRAAERAPGPVPRGPASPPPRPAGQVRRLRRGVGRPAGQGGYSGRWRSALALRARPQGEGAAHKGRVCSDAPPSALLPAAWGWGRETPLGPPPAGLPAPPGGGPRHRAWLAPPSSGRGRRPALGVSESTGCAPRAHP